MAGLVYLLFLLAAPPAKLMIIGDSLTAGYGLREEEAYPSLIQKKLSFESQSWQVINSGVSGDTTAGGLRRLDWLLKKARPDFVLIALGANDMLRGLPLEKSKANLRSMIQRVKASKTRVALIGIQAPANLGKSYEMNFNRMFKEIAETESIPFLPNLLEGVAGNSKLNQIDGIHPNAEGQKIMAENLIRFIKPLLKTVEDS